MVQERKEYDGQFKLAAAKTVLSGDKAVRDLSEELGVSAATLRRWAQDYNKGGERVFLNTTYSKNDKDFEITRLRKRVGDLEQENEVLKKFRAFLSQDRA